MGRFTAILILLIAIGSTAQAQERMVRSKPTRLPKLCTKNWSKPLYENFPRPTHVGSYLRIGFLLKGEYREVV